MDHINKIIEEYNVNKKRKILIAIYGMIADMLCNKNLNSVVTNFFIKRGKLAIDV